MLFSLYFCFYSSHKDLLYRERNVGSSPRIMVTQSKPIKYAANMTHKISVRFSNLNVINKEFVLTWLLDSDGCE